MDIRKRYLKFLFLFFLFLIYLVNFSILSNKVYYSSKLNRNDYNYENNAIPRSSALPDKVYTFDAPTDTFTDTFDLDDDYIYYIYIELVTPHNVSTMRIRIWDPDGKQYNIFQSEMFFYPEFGRYFEIPFGTAISGDYTFEFYTASNYNFNLHIQITKGPMCLHDKIDPQYVQNIIYYEVKTFTNGESISESELDLDSDVMYQFYFGRVSAISITQSNDVWIDFSLEDPETPPTKFVIYNKEKMEDIDGMNMFPFGTATKGEYSFDMTIYCNVAFVNIAFVIVEDFQIAEGIIGEDEEEKVITLEDIAEDITESAAALPGEWMIAALLFIGAIVSLSTILLINQRKMSNVALNIKEK